MNPLENQSETRLKLEQAEKTGLLRLSQLCSDFASETAEVRDRVTQQMSQFQETKTCCMWLIKLIACNNEPQITVMARYAASILFKNIIKTKWHVHNFQLDDDDNDDDQKNKKSKVDESKTEKTVSFSEGIDSDTREFIKVNLLSLILTVPRSIQLQLQESLSLIAKSDFPRRWPKLIREFANRLKNPVYAPIVLEIANSVLIKYSDLNDDDVSDSDSNDSGSDDDDFKKCLEESIKEEINEITNIIGPPLLQCFEQTIASLSQISSLSEANAPQGSVSQLLNIIWMITHLIATLCSKDLPPFLESHLDNFFTPLCTIFLFPIGTSSASTTLPSAWATPEVTEVFVKLQSVICDVHTLMVTKYTDEFEVQTLGFSSCVWKLLNMHSHGPPPTIATLRGTIAEPLQISLIGFLTVLAGLKRVDLLKPIDVNNSKMISELIVPSLMHRAALLFSTTTTTNEEEEEQEYYESFAEQEILGDGGDLYRRQTLKLVRALRLLNPSSFFELIKKQVMVLLELYSVTSVDRWIFKDVAFNLVIACYDPIVKPTTTSSTDDSKIGCTFNHSDFIQKHVLPELLLADINTMPLLKSDALKFICTFRHEITIQSTVLLLPLIFKFMHCTNVVTVANACLCVQLMCDPILIVLRQTLTNSNELKHNIEKLLPDVMPKLFAYAKGGDVAKGGGDAKCGDAKGGNDPKDGKDNVSGILKSHAYKTILTLWKLFGTSSSPLIGSLLHLSMQHLNQSRECASNEVLFQIINHVILVVGDSKTNSTKLEIALRNSLIEILKNSKRKDLWDDCLETIRHLLAVQEEISTEFTALIPLWLAPASYDDVHHHGTYAQILQIYIEKVPHVMLTFGDQKAKSVMGVFHKLFITKQSIEHAFSLLQQIATYLPHDEIWRLYGRPIVDLLWTRIEKNMVFTRSTVRYAQLLSRYVLRLIAVNGAQSLKLVIDARPGGYTLHDAFQNVMLPALSHKEDERATKEDSSKIYETCLHYLSHCLWNLNDPHNPFAIAYHQGMTLKKEYTTKNLWVQGLEVAGQLLNKLSLSHQKPSKATTEFKQSFSQFCVKNPLVVNLLKFVHPSSSMVQFKSADQPEKKV